MTKRQGMNFIEYFTVGAAANLLEVHPDTLRRWEKKGLIRATRHPCNKYRLFHVQDVSDLLEKMK